MLMIEYLTLTKLFYIDVIASIIQLYWRTFLYSALYCINLFLTPELEIDQPDPTRPSHYVRRQSYFDPTKPWPCVQYQ